MSRTKKTTDREEVLEEAQLVARTPESETQPAGVAGAAGGGLSGSQTLGAAPNTRGSHGATGRTRSRRRHLLRRSLFSGASRQPPTSGGPAAEIESSVDAEGIFVSDERQSYDLGLLVNRQFDLSRLEAHVVANKVCSAQLDVTQKNKANSEQLSAASDKILRSTTAPEHASEPLSPAVVAKVEKLCLLWISRKLARPDLCYERVDKVLRDGALLIRIAGLRAETLGDEETAYDVAVRNISRFLDAVRKAGIRSEDMFRLEDLIYGKNIPQVCRCVLLFANRIDKDELADCMRRLEPPRVSLEELLNDSVDEFWPGDFIVDRLTNIARSHFRRSEVNVLFAGSIGSGKSASINRIVGRFTAAANHAMKLLLSDEEILIRDPERGPEIVQERAYEKERLQRAYPNRKYESIPFPNEHATIYYVKKNGILLRLVEIPSTEKYLFDEGPEGMKSWAYAGSSESITTYLRDLEFDLIFLVERLDSYRSNGCQMVLEELKRLFGNRVWERCILVFTHGYSLPPEGLTFEENLARRIHLVQEVAHRVSGRGSTYIPVCVLENSASCARNAAGNLILPNGATFLDRFAMICENMLLRQRDVPRLKVRPSVPSHVRIRHIGFAFASILILQMLRNEPQSRQN